MIADEDKKEECDSIPPIERILSALRKPVGWRQRNLVVGENGTTYMGS